MFPKLRHLSYSVIVMWPHADVRLYFIHRNVGLNGQLTEDHECVALYAPGVGHVWRRDGYDHCFPRQRDAIIGSGLISSHYAEPPLFAELVDAALSLDFNATNAAESMVAVWQEGHARRVG
jgi:hypothetical protein